MHCHALIRRCHCLQGRLSFKCVAWRNHSPHLFLSSASSFLSVSLAFPLLFFRSTNQQLCLEGNQAAPANYAALGTAPFFLSFLLLPSSCSPPPLFYLTRLPSTLPLSVSTPVLSLSLLGTCPALHHSLKADAFFCCYYR